MRPVNLIPAEERPGGRRPLRTGPLPYIVVGALAAAVIAITALVVTESQISDRRTEVAQLEAERQSVEAKAQELAPYTQFAAVRQQRLETVTGLADSRFDWRRVLDELSLLLPANIQLTSLAGTASPEVGLSGGAGVGMRSQIAGPALELAGCGTSQAAVAGFVEALKDIDGVTRVGLQGSSGGGEGENATSATTCGGARSASFQMVAAFDAAPVPPAETGEATAEAPAEAAPEGGESETSESSGESGEASTGESSGGESEGAAE
ncbi:MAG TPA: PilN domain-containing protein [Solirubrobacterales bacterium]|nr:PilN domain-containing protein [Solirubrobacterales bacterium]